MDVRATVNLFFFINRPFDFHIGYSISFQHDINFIPPTEGDGPSLYPNQCFHLEKLNPALEEIPPGNTEARESLLISQGRQMRLREHKMFKARFGGETDSHTYSRRDFFALCRGETVVT